MNNNNTYSQKEHKPCVSFTRSFNSANQIDTSEPLLAEILRSVQRIERRLEELSNKISKIKDD